jgi:hypothetical protein
MNITFQFIHLQAEKQEKKLVVSPSGVDAWERENL